MLAIAWLMAGTAASRWPTRNKLTLAATVFGDACDSHTTTAMNSMITEAMLMLRINEHYCS